MSRWPDWIRRALEPTPAELDPGPPEDLLEIARAATAPLDDELMALRAPPYPSAVRLAIPWTALWGGLALAAAVLLLVWLWPAPAPELGVGTELALSGATHQLGPSIQLRGIGTASVEARTATGARVRVQGGGVRFDVDPNGPQRALVVLAGEVEVSVRGTVFDVFYVHERAAVHVVRGSVQVRAAGVEQVLEAGQSWSEEVPEAEVVAVAPPPPAPEPVCPVCVAPAPVASPAVAEAPLEVEPEPPLDLPPPVPPALQFAELLDRAEAEDRAGPLLGAIDQFLEDHPTSALGEEAEALRLEVGARIRPAQHVVHDIDVFLEARPAAGRRTSLLELRATLQRAQLHDCGAALPSYEALARESTGQTRARAEAWRGLCALQLGRTEEARAALQSAAELRVAEPLFTEVTRALEGL